jgi:hypothetical protein
MFIPMLIFYLVPFKLKVLFFISTYLTTFGAFMNLKTHIEFLVLFLNVTNLSILKSFCENIFKRLT